MTPQAPADEFIAIGAGEAHRVVVWLNEGRTVHLWDRDPWLLRNLLSVHELSQQLRERQLILYLGADLVDLIGSNLPVKVHRTLGAIYRDAVQLLESSEMPTAVMVDGELMVDDVIEAFEEEGHAVYRLDVEVPSYEEITYSLMRLAPEVVASINYRSGLGALCANRRVPLLTWEIDPSVSHWQPEESNASVQLFTYRKSTLGTLRSVGFERANHLPLAANPNRRVPTAQRECPPLTFVGRSMALEGRAHRTHAETLVVPGEDARRIDEILKTQAETPNTYRIPELVAESFPQTIAASRDVNFVQLIAEMAAAQKRLAIARALRPLGLAVWGDDGWSDVPALDYRGVARHTRDLNWIYSNSIINLDMSRIYQEDIVTMRVFDALACGGFVLSPYSDELAELFEVGVELECYRSLEELLDKCRYYLADPDKTEEIARRGRARVLRDHTVRKRVRTLLASAHRQPSISVFDSRESEARR
ncbi:MAG: glycosyltransferase [Myxococcota bacterium]